MINIGIIGAGRIGRLHAENMQHIPNVKIKGISDVMIAQMEDWAKEKNISIVTDNYEDLLRDPEIHAIFVCSPTTTHAEIIKKAAAAGKHIFCEKPVSFSVEETVEVINEVEKAGVKFQVGFNRRFDPNFKRLHDLVQQGQIGTPHILKITSRDPKPPTIDYVRTSGGLFMDMMIHDFDMARYIVNSEVVEVFAQGAVLIDSEIGKAGDIDTAVVTLKFENGALGVIDNSRQAVYGYDQRVEIFGDKGAATADNCRPTTVELSTSDHVVKDKPLYFFLERYSEAYIEEVKQFVHACMDNESVLCSGFDGLQAQRIAEAAQESFEKGVPVKVEF